MFVSVQSADRLQTPVQEKSDDSSFHKEQYYTMKQHDDNGAVILLSKAIYPFILWCSSKDNFLEHFLTAFESQHSDVCLYATIEYKLNGAVDRFYLPGLKIR